MASRLRLGQGMPRQNHTLRTVTPSETTPANVPRRSPELKRVQLEDRPALLASEDPKKYQELDSAVCGHLEPRDIIEEMLAGDVIDNQWNVARLRRLRADFVKRSTRESAVRIIEAAGEICGQHLADGWLRGDPESAEQVHELLASTGLTLPSIEAQTYATNMDTIERFDRMIAAAAGRRTGAIADLERRRQERSRLQAPPPIDADYRDLGK
jgi:hypothetical protein